MSIHLKDPQAILDYGIDWPPNWVGDAAISSVLWVVTPSEPGGIVVQDEVVEDLRTSVRLGGGVPGHVYRVAASVILSDGRADERSLTLRVEER
jgi:hypothetical protein